MSDSFGSLSIYRYASSLWDITHFPVFCMSSNFFYRKAAFLKVFSYCILDIISINILEIGIQLIYFKTFSLFWALPLMSFRGV